ncbi:MAG: hypothetical protein ABIJ08_06865, partial [Nanoarchaeota archaeon]
KMRPYTPIVIVGAAVAAVAAPFAVQQARAQSIDQMVTEAQATAAIKGVFQGLGVPEDPDDYSINGGYLLDHPQDLNGQSFRVNATFSVPTLGGGVDHFIDYIPVDMPQADIERLISAAKSSHVPYVLSMTTGRTADVQADLQSMLTGISKPEPTGYTGQGAFGVKFDVDERFVGRAIINYGLVGSNPRLYTATVADPIVGDKVDKLISQNVTGGNWYVFTVRYEDVNGLMGPPSDPVFAFAEPKPSGGGSGGDSGTGSGSGSGSSGCFLDTSRGHLDDKTNNFPYKSAAAATMALGGIALASRRKGNRDLKKARANLHRPQRR